MSTKWTAEFDNAKDHKHFVDRFNEIAPKGGNIIVPELPQNPKDVRCRGAWVDLDETIYDFCENFDEDIHGEPPVKDIAWAVSFDVAIWDSWTSDFIMALIQEMCHRYSFVEIGCDEMVSQQDFLQWKCFSTEKLTIDYMRRLYDNNPKAVECNGITTDKMDRAEQEILGLETEFREAAKRFFDGDASDLILTFKEE